MLRGPPLERTGMPPATLPKMTWGPPKGHIDGRNPCKHHAIPHRMAEPPHARARQHTLGIVGEIWLELVLHDNCRFANPAHPLRELFTLAPGSAIV